MGIWMNLPMETHNIILFGLIYVMFIVKSLMTEAIMEILPFLYFCFLPHSGSGMKSHSGIS